MCDGNSRSPPTRKSVLSFSRRFFFVKNHKNFNKRLDIMRTNAYNNSVMRLYE
nr:MAG TPA: hypothetical protein [Caudoviricetes sp.]